MENGLITVEGADSNSLELKAAVASRFQILE